jgi:hypothetical protein
VAVDVNKLIQAVSDRQQATESQLTELVGVIKALQARLGSPADKQEASRDEQVSPETLVVIAAAVTAFLGKKVRIRSAKLLRSRHGVANSWSQQGRILIHASHHLR